MAHVIGPSLQVKNMIERLHFKACAWSLLSDPPHLRQQHVAASPRPSKLGMASVLPKQRPPIRCDSGYLPEARSLSGQGQVLY